MGKKKPEEQKPKTDWVKHGSYLGRDGSSEAYQKMLQEAASAPVKVEKPRDIKPEPPENLIRRALKKLGGSK